MPKCAGSTCREHIEQSLDEPMRLGLYNSKKMTLSRQDVFDKVDSLSEKEKGLLRIIYGHEVYYGLHEYFSRPVRYIVFLRNVLDRTLSFFNYQLQMRGKEIFNCENDFTFIGWFEKNTWVHDEMLGYFYDYGFIPSLEEVKTKDFNVILDKFWFVGLTENADENYLFLYKKLGINRFLPNQNISKKALKKFNHQEKELILNYSANDNQLYTKAVMHNTQFKKTNRFYNSTVFFMKQKRMVRSLLSGLKNKVLQFK